MNVFSLLPLVSICFSSRASRAPHKAIQQRLRREQNNITSHTIPDSNLCAFSFPFSFPITQHNRLSAFKKSLSSNHNYICFIWYCGVRTHKLPLPCILMYSQSQSQFIHSFISGRVWVWMPRHCKRNRPYSRRNNIYLTNEERMDGGMNGDTYDYNLNNHYLQLICFSFVVVFIWPVILIPILGLILWLWSSDTWRVSLLIISRDPESSSQFTFIVLDLAID